MRSLTLLAAVAVTACRPAPTPAADLHCDIIRADVVPDVHRLEIRRGNRLGSTLHAGNRGRIIVRVQNHRDSSAVGRIIGVVLTRHDNGEVRSSNANGLSIQLEPATGRYHAMVSCLGCSRSGTTIDVAAGRADTIDAYLTRFPNNCEVNRKQSTAGPRHSHPAS